MRNKTKLPNNPEQPFNLKKTKKQASDPSAKKRADQLLALLKQQFNKLEKLEEEELKEQEQPEYEVNEALPALPALSANIQQLFSLEKIEKHHFESLNNQQKAQFEESVNYKLKTLKDEERDFFIEQISAFLDKEKLWEFNHSKITDAITEYIERTGSMPPKAEIARTTGLSRRTVSQHLIKYSNDPVNEQQEHIFDFMTSKIKTVVMKEALKGNMQAARLFLDTQQKNKAKDTVINTQHSYIQINNTVLSQQNLQQLKPEQLLQIEQLVQKALSEKV